ncbi:p53 and DNA damage-regulated protein 1 [Phlyctochytrium bullatum]|nr:p53 and DNA damage-regulated protein 1 [Phlyctochytrium bullatum]
MDLIEKQVEIEGLAEQILVNRRLIIDYDRRRNTNREALRCFHRKDLEDGKRVWFNCGTLMLKVDQDTAKRVILEEQDRLDKEIDRLRMEIKDLVVDLEKKERLLAGETQGRITSDVFRLKGISRDDIKQFLEHE